jgi:hypothetical protein
MDTHSLFMAEMVLMAAEAAVLVVVKIGITTIHTMVQLEAPVALDSLKSHG